MAEENTKGEIMAFAVEVSNGKHLDWSSLCVLLDKLIDESVALGKCQQHNGGCGNCACVEDLKRAALHPLDDE